MNIEPLWKIISRRATRYQTPYSREARFSVELLIQPAPDIRADNTCYGSNGQHRDGSLLLYANHNLHIKGRTEAAKHFGLNMKEEITRES